MIRLLSEYLQGAGYFIKGVAFLKRNPSLLKYLLLPFCLSALLYILMFVLFFSYNATFTSYLLPGYEDSFFLSAVWYLLFWGLNAFILIVMLLTAALVTNIIASPFYDYVSVRIEAQREEGCGFKEAYGGRETTLFGEAGKAYLLIKEEFKKSLFIIAFPAVALMIPVAGPMLATILLTVFIAWEYIDYPLSRKKVTLRERLSVIYHRKMYFLGFGTPLIIPVLNFFLFPIAIVGATLLYLDRMDD